MGREIGKLKALNVSRMKEPGDYGDGGGLWLRVKSATSRHWMFRYVFGGKQKRLGLGSLSLVPLAEARDKATEMRKVLANGGDPADRPSAENQETDSTEATSAVEDLEKPMTFKACAEAYIEAHKGSWKNAKHRAQWSSTLDRYVYPVFGDLSPSEVTTAKVKDVIAPLWGKKTETASRVRGRIETILDWATVHGFRTGDNPARWKNHFQYLLPRQSKVQGVEHHAALPYEEIAEFMHDLGTREAMSALCLQFVILTVTRTNEAIGAQWDEIALEKELWTIPKERMKSNREHRVPLSKAAMQILLTMPKEVRHGFVFKGNKERALSNMAMLTLLRRMDRNDLTVHGFRSTFRDWAAEVTEFPNEMVEMALAHVVSDKTEAAYRRGDMFERRRALMQAWADYCFSMK